MYSNNRVELLRNWTTFYNSKQQILVAAAMLLAQFSWPETVMVSWNECEEDLFETKKVKSGLTGDVFENRQLKAAHLEDTTFIQKKPFPQAQHKPQIKSELK